MARKTLAPYASKGGKCWDSEDTRLFVMEVIQRLLYKGAGTSLRKWCFCAVNGCITLPEDLETLLKFRINGRVESVWSKWYDFSDVSSEDECGRGWLTGITQEPNDFFTIYDLPKGGAKIVALPYTKEASDARIIIHGLDEHGKEIFIKHNGQQMTGEYLEISKDFPKRSQATFTRITGIDKSVTEHYVRLYWVIPETGERGLLAEYKPNDTFPSYRRARLPGVSEACPARVEILGRIKEPDYKNDNDILPITNLSALRKMAQAIQSEDGNQLQEAQYKEVKVEALLQEENLYKRSGEEPFNFVFDTSPGADENLQ